MGILHPSHKYIITVLISKFEMADKYPNKQLYEFLKSLHLEKYYEGFRNLGVRY